MAGFVSNSKVGSVFEDLMNDEAEKMSEEDREDARKFHLGEAVRFGHTNNIREITDEEIRHMTRAEKIVAKEYYSMEVKRFEFELSEEEEEEREEEDDWCEEEHEGDWCEEERPVPAPRTRPVPAPRARHYTPPEPDAEGLRECIFDLKYEVAELEEKNILKKEMNTLMVRRNTLTEEEGLLKANMLTAEEEWGFLLRDESPPTTHIAELIEETEELRKRAECAENSIRKKRSEIVMSSPSWWRRWFLWWL